MNDRDAGSVTPETDMSPKSQPNHLRRWLLGGVALSLLAIGGVAGFELATQYPKQALSLATLLPTPTEESRVTPEGVTVAPETTSADTPQAQSLDQIKQSIQQERHLLQLDYTEARIEAGWQLWLATGDSAALVKALQSGLQALGNDSTPAGLTLRQAMTHDLDSIKAQHPTDLTEIIGHLDRVIADVPHWPLVQDQPVPATPQGGAEPIAMPTTDTLSEKARQFVIVLSDEIWQSIRSMVRVQRLDRAEAALIAPEQRVFLQQSLRLLLLDARHALLQRNTAIYQQTLIQAHQWVSKYFDTQNAQVKGALTALQTMASTAISPVAVNLEATQHALAAARAQWSGLVPMPEAAGDVNSAVAPSQGAAE